MISQLTCGTGLHAWQAAELIAMTPKKRRFSLRRLALSCAINGQAKLFGVVFLAAVEPLARYAQHFDEGAE